MKKRLLAILLTLCMLIGLLPATALANGEGTSTSSGPVLELDISQGSITITNNGYKLENDTGVIKVKGTWGSEPHKLTITQSNPKEPVSNYIEVQSGTVEITLKGVNLTNDSRSPFKVGGNGTKATVVLEGENTLTGTGNRCAGLEVATNATVTIQVPEGKPDNYGTLTANGSARSAGIGGIFGQHAGIVNIKSGTIDATGGAYVSGIGPGRERTMKEINISGGHITNRSAGNISLGFETWRSNTAGKVTISGGYLDTNGISGTNVSISGGTIVTSKNPGIEYTTLLSITGGNIGDAYTGAIDDRTLTKLAFFDENGTPKAKTEVTVTEGQHKWTALTDDEGMVTTYLAEGTRSVSVQIGEDEEENVAISDGLGVVGASCTCANDPGTLAMTTQPQTLTVTGESETLELAAAYTKGSCVLREGFHGDYENISYDITRVVKNGQYMVESQYAKIENDTLTVYGETNQDSYTVYVRAISGPEDDKVSSKEVAITVNTYVSEADEGELDIADGPIIITDSGYSQGETTVNWSNNENPHTLTITGESSGSNNIVVQGGNPVITLKDVTMSMTSGNLPAILLYGGTGDGKNRAADATIVLEGNNTLTSSGAPAIQININATLTIQGEGELSASSSKNNTSGIGAGDANAYAYASADGNAKTNNNYRSGGNLVVENGTVNATGNGRGTNQYVAGIGASYFANLGSVTIEGGRVTVDNNDANGAGISGNAITISGGVVEDLTGGSRGGIYAIRSFTMSGGTISGSAVLRTAEDVTVSITGGNVNGYYDAAIEDHTLTKLYFVNNDGTPKANTQVTVKEGAGGTGWTARTDENGVVTTYLASTTDSLTAGGNPVEVQNGQALIGGTCSCSTVQSITWEPGLPGTVTLYGDQTFAVAAAELVTDTSCAMPIHPSLPGITYSLEVKKDDTTPTENPGDYAVLEGGTLTLKKQNAPYTVTLTATAGGKSEVCTVSALAGTTNADQTVIDLSKGNVTISSGEGDSYTYTQGEGGTSSSANANILLTGNAANAVVTVNADNINLGIAQDVTGNVWTILAGENVTGISIDIETLAGKVRFGNEGDQQYLMGYVSGEKVKLNPDAGDITLGDGSAAQGKFTVKGLDSRSAVIGGADTEADRRVTNSGTDALSVEINGETVSLTAGGSHTIEKANDSSIKDDGTVASYLLNGTTLLNEFSSEDPKYSYMTAEKFCELIGDAEVVGTVTGYRLAVVGEGSTAGLRGYRENGTLDQQKIAELYLDADLTEIISDTTNAYENDFLFYTNIRSLSIDHAKSVGLYSCFFESIHLGPQVESLASSNYLRGLQEITVDEENEYYQTVDGVLYTKDGSTLILCPTGKTGNYKILDTCTAIADVSFYGSHLSKLTFGNQLSSLGSRWMENARFTAVHVPTSNPYFKSEDGVLYSLDGATLLYYPVYKTDSEFSIPEGVTTIANMGIYSQYRLKKLTLPSTLSSVGAYVFRGSPLEELDIKTTTLASASINSSVLSKVTVPDGYNFTNSLLKNTPMAWTQGITVSGGGNISYDGESHSISVLCQNDADVDIQYSLDGKAWSDSVTCVKPGEYTVYWKATKSADYVDATEDAPASGYAFDRVLYSSRTITITGLEADESWFTLSEPVNEGSTSETPVTLNQPTAAPPLEGGYTVKYSKDGTETATETAPIEAGSYLVTVVITADGYIKEDLTLGYYTILSTEQSSMKVLSFVTNGGRTIKPIIAAVNADITAPAKPTRDGYTFEGWYSDAALRTPATVPGSMPDTNKTYYAKWTRDSYNITYNLNDGTDPGNPTTYHVETTTFTLLAPEKPGYEFTGWTGSNGETAQKEVSIAKGSTGDKTYTANWEMITYNITYPNIYDRVDGNPASYTVESSDLNITSPAERDGYTFAGWTMVVDGTSYILPAENAAIPAGTLGDITLTGIWLAQNQTITLNANGGTFAGGSKTMTITAEYGSSVTLSTTPTRSGYTFAGWYTDEACTMQFTGGTMPLTTTIYAKWDRIYTGGGGGGGGSVTRYEVSAPAADNGKVTVSPASASKGQTVTITVTPDEGYELASLTVTDKDGKAVTLTDKGDGKYTFTMPGGKVTVTARFRAVEPAPVVLPFTDVVQGAWYYDAVVYAYQNGLMEGTGDTTFAPGMTTTRSMLATLLYRLEGEPAVSGGAAFTDVPAGTWYTDAVAWAAREGVVNGVGDGTAFAPDAPITREQMAVMLYRYAQYKGYDVSQGGMAAREYADYGQVSGWAQYAMDWAVASGLITGTSDTTLSPQGQATRAEIATILMRFCENVVK